MEVKLIAYSQAPNGQKIATFALEYPRFIHAELMTHRVFSRNGQSSRAVTLRKSLSQSPVFPTSFGKNAPGMSSKEALSPLRTIFCKALWWSTANGVRAAAFLMSKLGLHKQWANRPLEWQQNIKVVVTSTEWDNYFGLRLDSATVQPEMVELAKAMKHEMDLSDPVQLQPGEWHLPYIDTYRNPVTGTLQYFVDVDELTLAEAKTISVSCCAQVSYRNLDKNLYKAEQILARLADRDDPHLSPFEHQATPVQVSTEDYCQDWEAGVTHMSRGMRFWSGNFCGFIQNRQLMEM